jgi:hypothetical protein
MTRRELTDAVVEAAKVAVKEHFARWGMASTAPGTIALKETVAALDACTEPDLDALDHAVAEAVEAYITRGGIPRPDLWKRIEVAYEARRAALAPKPRYTVEPNSTLPVRVVVYDTQESRPLTPPEVAALLNQKEVKP